MQAIYKTVEDCRGLVFGSPVYFDHVTAQAKVFIDRLYRNWDTKLERVAFPPGFKGVIAITYENPNQDRYEFLVDWLRYWLEHRLGVETVGVLKAPATSKQPVSDRPDLLESAYNLGKVLARG
jgi:multimeric flavodoxin WrbA